MMGLTHSYTPGSAGTSIRSPHQRPSPNPKAMGVSQRKRHSLPAMTTFGHLQPGWGIGGDSQVRRHPGLSAPSYAEERGLE